ncbi:hypothetical protein OH799_05925 [Nocardia sp. NBC_00881]|uniref:hypothetical protein n=1 Tax=Nocardia sp. NBC_00881 TaxID=2975995 RepID=UPI00386B2E13|nr:hypothetical protein OH799_05925 [Nocardia sp. NBC_00881]
MIVLTADNANTLSTSAARAITDFGEPVSLRGMATTEILGGHLRLTPPRRRLVDVPPLRLLNPAFAVAEALWILSSSNDDWDLSVQPGVDPLRRRRDPVRRLRAADGPVERHRPARPAPPAAPTRPRHPLGGDPAL